MEMVMVFITDIMFNKLQPDNGNVIYSILTQSLCSQILRPETIKFIDIYFVTSHNNIFIFYSLLENGFLKEIDFFYPFSYKMK